MVYYVVKVLLSAVTIVAVTEIAKRSSTLAALVASLPLTSLLAFVWLHLEGSTPAQISALSAQVFWLVLPSLVLFVVFPLLLRQGQGFWPALGFAMLATVLAYGGMVMVLRWFKVDF